MLKKDKELLKVKTVRLNDLKEEIGKLHAKAATTTTTNVDAHITHLNGICTTFMNNNTTACWHDWLNNRVTPDMASRRSPPTTTRRFASRSSLGHSSITSWHPSPT